VNKSINYFSWVRCCKEARKRLRKLKKN